MLKRWLCALLLIALLPAAFAEGFVFDGSITWSTTVDEAAVWLGGVTALDESMGDYGMLSVVGSEDAACLNRDGVKVMLLFYDGALFWVVAYFTPDSLGGDIGALAQTLSEAYGEPHYPEHGKEILSLDDLFNTATGGGAALYCRWKPDEDTKIQIDDFSGVKDADGTPSPYLCCLSVSNTEVQNQFEHALSAYYGLDD